jgi:hypothetical protein
VPADLSAGTLCRERALPDFSDWLRFYGAPAGVIEAANGSPGSRFNFRNRLIAQIVSAAGGAELRREFEIAARMGPAPEFGEVAEHLVLELGRAPPTDTPHMLVQAAIAHWPRSPWRVAVTGWPIPAMVQFIDKLWRSEAHWRAELAEGRMAIIGRAAGGALIRRSGEAIHFDYGTGKVEFLDGVILAAACIAVPRSAEVVSVAVPPKKSTLRAGLVDISGTPREKLRNAIREVLKALPGAAADPSLPQRMRDYDADKGEKPPNLVELPPMVQAWLAKKGRWASVDAIRDEAKKPEFAQRLRRGEKLFRN